MQNGFKRVDSSLTEPPGPIDNSKIALTKAGGHVQVKQGKACPSHLIVRVELEVEYSPGSVCNEAGTEQDGVAEKHSSLHIPVLTALSEPSRFSIDSSCMTSSLI